MKKIFLLAILFASFTIGLKAQETPPAGLKSVNGQFYINLVDSAIWHNKGVPYGWERLARYKDIITPDTSILATHVYTNRYVLKSTTVAGFDLRGNITLGTLSNGYGFSTFSYNAAGSVLLKIDTSLIQTVNNFFPKGDTRYIKLSQKGAASGVATLDGAGKVPLSQINDSLIGSVNYQGSYNASTNTPSLPTAATANKGYYWVVSTPGTQFGLTLAVGDWIISNGSVYQKIDNNNAVTSVNSQVGAVVLTTANVSEVTNLYYTNARVQTFSDARYVPYTGATGSVGLGANSLSVNYDNNAVLASIPLGLKLENNTLATSGQQIQFSPALYFSSSSYQGAGPARKVEIRQYSTYGSSNTFFNIDYNLGSTGWLPMITMGSAGVNVPGSLGAASMSATTAVFGNSVSTNRVLSPVITPLNGANLVLSFETGGITAAVNQFTFGNGPNSTANSSGLVTNVRLLQNYNQTGTASSTDFLINRVETALGSGTHLFADFQVGGVSKFKIDRTGILTLGTWQGVAIADTYISSATNWNTAYTDRNKWDGGSTGLVAATGRTSLGLGTAALVADNTLVHLSGTENITGQKTFTANTYFTNSINILNGTSSGSITSTGITAPRTASLPDKDGIFAFTSDLTGLAVDANVIHLAGTEIFTGAKYTSSVFSALGSGISSPDGMGAINVTMPADANNYAMFGVTRLGGTALGIGVGNTNNFIIGTSLTNRGMGAVIDTILFSMNSVTGDITSTGYITGKTLRPTGYTVSTLPVGNTGDIAYVTDALAPSYHVAVVGGGATVTLVFYNGSAWVAN